jgi:hypothetical protein
MNDALTPAAKLQVAMAGPRLAVRVSELLRRAAKTSPYTREEIAARLATSPENVDILTASDGNLHLVTLARLFEATGFSVALQVTGPTGERLTIPTRGGQLVEEQDE